MNLLASLVLLFAICAQLDGKPPKNLRKLGRGGAGNNMQIPSIINNGLFITEGLEDSKNETTDGKGQSENSRESIGNDDGTDDEMDDLDEILAGDLDSTETTEHHEESTTPIQEYTTTSLEDIARIRMEIHTPIQQPQTSDTEILERLLTKGYDWRVRPPGHDGTIHGGPVVVNVNMLIRSISKIDNVNMEYSVQLTFRESWRDSRLSYGRDGDTNPEFLILTAGQQIWMPDSFFQNEKQAYKHMIDKPNVLIRVHKDGTILYSVRISLVLSCPMHLQYYPMDVQECFIDLASYAYTTKDIEYVWKSEEPVQRKAGLSSSLPSFQLNNVSTTYCTSNTNTGAYSCLRTVLEFRRQFSYYLLQLYIPSSMLVIVSWVSFWIDRTAVPARVTLGVTTLLTMTTQSSGMNSKLPPVAYLKAIDVWIAACMTFIFGALLEFAFVTYIANRKDPKKSKKVSKKDSEKQNSLVGKGSTEVWIPRIVSEQDREIDRVVRNRKDEKGRITRFLERHVDWQDVPKRADVVSRVMFPFIFLSFNVVYWLYYAQYQTAQPPN